MPACLPRTHRVAKKQVLEEGATAARRSGLALHPACFVPALRACCAGGGGDDDENHGRSREAGSRAEDGAALMEEMEARAGVTPDAWCANVVMEVGKEDAKRLIWSQCCSPPPPDSILSCVPVGSWGGGDD